MSCFWDAISQSLTPDEISNKLHILVKGKNPKKKNIIRPNAKQVASALKSKNKLVSDVTWNGETLTDQLQKENYEAIKEYCPTRVNQGYLCSTCEPFLLLLSTILTVNIDHHYLNHHIDYQCEGASETIYFRSNRGHISYSHRKRDKRIPEIKKIEITPEIKKNSAKGKNKKNKSKNKKQTKIKIKLRRK